MCQPICGSRSARVIREDAEEAVDMLTPTWMQWALLRDASSVEYSRTCTTDCQVARPRAGAAGQGGPSSRSPRT
jgi:hypothetical protein